MTADVAIVFIVLKIIEIGLLSVVPFYIGKMFAIYIVKDYPIHGGNRTVNYTATWFAGFATILLTCMIVILAYLVGLEFIEMNLKLATELTS